MSLTSTKDLFLAELRDLHSTEKQLVKALGKLAKAAQNPELAQAFQTHQAETQEHQERLEKLFSQLGEKPGRKKCKGIEGIILEGEEHMEEEGDAMVKDSALIAGAQRAEHYEMAGYGCAATYAELLGETEAAHILRTTLEEEKATDKKLTELARSILGMEAESESESSDDTNVTSSSLEVGGAATSNGGARNGAMRGGRSQTMSTGSSTLSQGSMFMPRNDYDDERGGNGRSSQFRERDEQGQFTSGGRGGSSTRYADDDDDRRYSNRGDNRSSSRYDDEDDRGRGGSYEGRSEGGRRSSEMQERDEFGQFAGNRGGGGGRSRSDDDDDRRYSGGNDERRGSSFQYDEDDGRGGRFPNGGGRSGYRYDDERSGYSESRRSSETPERDEYGRFVSDDDDRGGRSQSRSGGGRGSSSRGSGDDDRGGNSRSRGGNDDERGGNSRSRGGRGGEHVDSAGRHYSRESWERAQEGRARGGQHSHGGR